MSVPNVLLGVLAEGPAHGYDLKRAHDVRFPGAKQLAYGQVYAALGRLERDGLVEVVETGRDGGPERMTYAMTDAGSRALATWLGERRARRAVRRRRPGPQGGDGVEAGARRRATT